MDCMEDPEKYNEKNIILRGMYAQKIPNYNISFILGRQAMVCCAQDTSLCGVTVTGVKIDQMTIGAWVEVEGTLRTVDMDNGAKTVVLTGVYFDQLQLGAAALDVATGEISYAMGEWVNGCYHGTGDTFTSVLLAALLNDCPLNESLQIAVDFVSRCVARTSRDHPYMTYGVNFEAELPYLMKALKLV